ncbi:MAG TPA: globin domain-containing protein [Chitinophagaceae bacterium]|nr:globin domain-containing protein [Chitinophagaceae bacterium]
MTAKQTELVKETWALVANMDTHTVGMLFYNRLFEIAPQLKAMFPKDDMKSQVSKLLIMLTYIISKLDRLDELRNEVAKLAQRHVKYGVQDEHYEWVGRALLWTLEIGLQKKWDDEVKMAWTVCYTTLSDAMKDAAYLAADRENAVF